MAGHYLRPHRNYLADSYTHYPFLLKSSFQAMVVCRDVFQPLAVFHKFKSFSLTFLFNVACSVIFSQYPNLHNSYVNCFIDSFNFKCDASSVLMEYCPEFCIWKVKYLCINGTWNSLLIHGFSLVNARLLKAFGTAFYAIITLKTPSKFAADDNFMFLLLSDLIFHVKYEISHDISSLIFSEKKWKGIYECRLQQS